MGDFADLGLAVPGGSLGRAWRSWPRRRRSAAGSTPPTSWRCAARRSSTTSGGSPSRSRIWQKPGPLTRGRVGAGAAARVPLRARARAARRSWRALAPVAGAHHERLDGSGYHRGAAGAALTLPARLLAAADAYHAMTEPRPHREPLAPERGGARRSAAEASAGRLDADAVAAVLEAAGQRRARGSSGRRG